MLLLLMAEAAFLPPSLFRPLSPRPPFLIVVVGVATLLIRLLFSVALYKNGDKVRLPHLIVPGSPRSPSTPSSSIDFILQVFFGLFLFLICISLLVSCPLLRIQDSSPRRETHILFFLACPILLFPSFLDLNSFFDVFLCSLYPACRFSFFSPSCRALSPLGWLAGVKVPRLLIF